MVLKRAMKEDWYFNSRKMLQRNSWVYRFWCIWWWPICSRENWSPSLKSCPSHGRCRSRADDELRVWAGNTMHIADMAMITFHAESALLRNETQCN
jgi:hypothetical protein